MLHIPLAMDRSCSSAPLAEDNGGAEPEAADRGIERYIENNQEILVCRSVADD